MTFQELNAKMGGNEVESEWRQHKNGGGWVKNTALVYDEAYVGPDAIVCGNSVVYGTGSVYSTTIASGSDHIYGAVYPLASNDEVVRGDAWATECELKSTQ